MSLRLILIAHAATDATRQAAFPLNEGLEPQGLLKAEALTATLGRVDAAWVGPSLRTRQTAAALGLSASIDPALADIDLGDWTGRSLSDVAASDAEGLARWTTDPEASPHGGETISDLVGRVALWLDSMQRIEGRVLAVTHAAVIRAAMITILEANPRSFWRIDVEPLCFARVHAHAGRWTLRSLGNA